MCVGTSQRSDAGVQQLFYSPPLGFIIAVKVQGISLSAFDVISPSVEKRLLKPQIQHSLQRLTQLRDLRFQTSTS